MSKPAMHFFDDRDLSGAYAYLCFEGDSSLPAIGGVRVLPYSNLEEAQVDAIRLAQCMTLKAKTHELPLSGAKMVCSIPHANTRDDFFKRLGGFINSFKGRYIAAMDSGVSLNDMDILSTTSPYVCNNTRIGSPAPYTAQGVFESIMLINHQLFQQTPSELSVSVIGAGAVGRLLIDRLHPQIGSLQVAEINKDIRLTLKNRGIHSHPTKSSLELTCDILAPCAIGGLIGNHNIDNLRCRMILGAANNPLKAPLSVAGLAKRSIAYVPDFISNGGGLIFCAAEYLKKPELLQSIEKIPDKSIDYIIKNTHL